MSSRYQGAGRKEIMHKTGGAVADGLTETCSFCNVTEQHTSQKAGYTLLKELNITTKV